jgi:hypothetical protein
LKAMSSTGGDIKHALCQTRAPRFDSGANH